MARMLAELTVRNFAVIQETRVTPTPGLNVITGETGAGKSLLVDALEFVLGGRADRELIRAGADAASVEAVFQLPNDSPLYKALAEQGITVDEDGVLVIWREVHPEGRSLCRINGRTVSVGAVREAGALLVDIHGQGTHLSLLDTRFQLSVLDAYAGLEAEREAVASTLGELRRLRQELTDLNAGAAEAERERDLLVFQLDEVESAGLRPGEEAELLEQRDLLAHAQDLQEACAEAYEALREGPANAGDLIARALLALGRSPHLPSDAAQHIAALESAAAQIEEAARGLVAYAQSIEHDPARLEEVEERLDLVRRLKRKYGGTEEAALPFAEQARAEMERIEQADERRAGLEARLHTALQHSGTLALQLSIKRRRAAESLALDAVRELAGLGLAQITFQVTLAQRESEDGVPAPDGHRYAFNRSGIDEAQFLVETNKGEGLKPLAKVASGGETSRMLLALKSALRGASGVPTLVFDEIDVGVGGRAGDVVGRKLWELSAVSQVLCVTHLPQIAAYADSHFRVDKALVDGRTHAHAEPLAPEARVEELAAMLGGARSERLDNAARELLERAAGVKSTFAVKEERPA